MQRPRELQRGDSENHDFEKHTKKRMLSKIVGNRGDVFRMLFGCFSDAFPKWILGLGMLWGCSGDALRMLFQNRGDALGGSNLQKKPCLLAILAVADFATVGLRQHAELCADV